MNITVKAPDKFLAFDGSELADLLELVNCSVSIRRATTGGWLVDVVGATNALGGLVNAMGTLEHCGWLLAACFRRDGLWAGGVRYRCPNLTVYNRFVQEITAAVEAKLAELQTSQPAGETR